MLTSLHGSQKGFTLFELLVVLILMAAVAAVVIPSFTGGLRGLELDTSARDLLTQMKRARTQAISEQSVYRIILQDRPEDQDPAFYQLTNEYEQPLESVALPEGVSVKGFSEENVRTGIWKISFYPNGRSSGGAFALALKGGKQLTIEVDPVTGFGEVIRGERQDNRTWP